MALAGIFAASCEDDPIPAVYDPASVTGLTLGSVSGTELAVDGSDITMTYSDVDYKLDCGTTYTLYGSASEDFSTAERVKATISNGKITISQADLNTTILNLGGEENIDFPLYLRLSAWMINDKGTAIDKTLATSNVVNATFVPYNAIIFDKDVYPHVWVQGDYCGWDFAKSQYLYDYEKSGNTYSGVVDFGEKAANGIKFTGDGKWDESVGNWGSEDQSEEPEAGSIQLVNSGGSKNIKCYSMRFYHFTLNTTTLMLTKDWGANQIGIIGLNGDWENDIPMEYNADLVRFYVDIDVPAATEMKFRADGSWDLNWGQDCKRGGDNIPVEAGKYRVYLDLNKNTITFDSKMYGKDEPTAGGDEPETPAYQGYGIIGTMNGWDGDIEMKETDGVWTGVVELVDTSEFKIRKDADWTENYGGTFAALDTPFEAEAGGDNIKPALTGKYDVIFDSNAKTITLSTHIDAIWSLIGVNGDWENDIVMTEVAPGIWVSPKTSITAAGWKIRYARDWTVNRGAATPTQQGEFVEAVQDGGNINLTGDLIVVYNANNETIGTLVWGVVGSIASIDGFNWNADIPMNLGSDGKFYSVPVALTTDDHIKLRQYADWGANRGGSCTAADTEFEVAQDGSDIAAPAAGTYMIVYDPASEKITLSTKFWGMIGGFNNWGGDLFMMYDGAGKWVAYNKAISGEWKLRQGSAWTVNRGGAFSAAGTAFEVTQDGSNITVTGLDTFDIIYDSTAETVTIQ